MPIYEYTCIKCGDSFTAIKPVNLREEKTACPKCGSTDIRKQLSTFNAGCYSGGGGGG